MVDKFAEFSLYILYRNVNIFHSNSKILCDRWGTTSIVQNSSVVIILVNTSYSYNVSIEYSQYSK